MARKKLTWGDLFFGNAKNEIQKISYGTKNETTVLASRSKGSVDCLNAQALAFSKWVAENTVRLTKDLQQNHNDREKLDVEWRAKQAQVFNGSSTKQQYQFQQKRAEMHNREMQSLIYINDEEDLAKIPTGASANSETFARIVDHSKSSAMKDTNLQKFFNDSHKLIHID